MATYAIAAGEIAVSEKTLGASTVDTVTVAAGVARTLEVLNEGTTGIYFTLDGTAPVVGAAAGWYVPPDSVRVVFCGQQAVSMKLISSGTPKYSVTAEF